MKYFIDSSAFIAYANRNDQYHNDAVTIFNTLSDQSSVYHEIITSFYVIDETITSLRYHLGHSIAKDWASQIFSSRIIDIIVEDKELLMHSWNIFRKYQDKKLSFTDCVIVSITEKNDIDHIFTFDEDFSKIGLQVIP